jgi:xylan 1,4-beta-xylosidase
MKTLKNVYLLFFSLTAFIHTVNAQSKASIEVNFDKNIAPMKPIWAWFGYDEPNYTYMKDGQKLLTEISKLSPCSSVCTCT